MDEHQGVTGSIGRIVFEPLCVPFSAAGPGGRDKPEELSDIRPEYQRDRDRILHSKAFSRLKHKTQVFLAPEGDHYRTSLTHTLEVSQIARTIAKTLRLNESLTEAIAWAMIWGIRPSATPANTY